MKIPTPLRDPPEDEDIDQMNFLSNLHYVMAGILFVGLLVLCAHFVLVRNMLLDQDFYFHSQRVTSKTDPTLFFSLFTNGYVYAGLSLFIMGLLNFISGRQIYLRKYRLFSLLVAVLNCIQIPLGTALGVFTFVLLSRYAIHALYTKFEVRLD